METPGSQSASHCPSRSDVSSPDPRNNPVTKEPMSATLRERLRKTRRSFASSSVVKRLKIDGEDSVASVRVTAVVAQGGCAGLEENAADTVMGRSPLTAGDVLNSHVKTSLDSPRQVMDNNGNYQDMIQERRRLLKQVEKKQEIVRRLNMVKLYRSKNNLAELQSLIEKWRKSSQQMLYELQTALSSENSNISLTQLIDNCGLDRKLLRYNSAEEDFEIP
ncbi:swi5-dependent recombination DNA repair protein 1 homolog [Pelodytes ibericus]